MSNAFAFLERFEDSDEAALAEEMRAEQARAAIYADGYAAGEAAALSKASAQNEELKATAAALQQKLSGFDADAASILCDSLRDAALKIFPALAAKGFAHEAAANMKDIVSNSEKASVVVKTAPDQVETVRNAFADSALSDQTEIVGETILSGNQVNAEWSGGGVTFDTQKAIDLFLDALEKAIQELKDEN